MTPLLDLDFKTTFVDAGVLYTPSRGTLLTRAQMGSGALNNTNAPSIGGIGARFDGNDGLKLAAQILDYNTPRTIVIRGRFLPTGATFQALFINSDNGITNYHAMCFRDALNKVMFWASHPAGGYVQVDADVPMFRPSTIVFRADGTGTAAGMDFYVNGKLATTYKAGSVTQTICGARLPTIGVQMADDLFGRTYLLSGSSMRRFQAYPFACSAAQAAAVHERFEREGES